MPDLYAVWSSDLVASPTGDVQAVDGSNLGVQRILRRLMTNPGDYIWHLNYGAGLPRLVGETLDLPTITELIRSQIYLEAAVARQPEPVITVRAIPNGIAVSIQYTDAQTGKQTLLSFDVSA